LNFQEVRDSQPADDNSNELGFIHIYTYIEKTDDGLTKVARGPSMLDSDDR
jgi:hypothetical protein